MSFYTQPSGANGAVALLEATATIIGGVNAKRTSILVANNGGETIWLMWGNWATPPDAATVKATGIPVQSGYNALLGATLTSEIGGNTPTLFGVTDSGDQSSPADTRWSEQG